MRSTSDSGRKLKQIDAARGDAGVGRERDHRHAALARRRADDADRMREQRPDDDLGALGERLLRRLLRAAGVAAVVLHQKLDVRAVEFGQRHLGGVLHRLRHGAGVAAGRQRQDQADLDRAGADRGRRLRRRRAGGGLLLNSSEMPEQRRQQGQRAGQQAADAGDAPRAQAGCNRACKAGAMAGLLDSDVANGDASPRWQTGHNDVDRLTKWKG